MNKLRVVFCLLITSLLNGCGFHMQGEMQLAAPLHRMYLQTPDPYGLLARNLKQYLKMSDVTLVASPLEAETILVIMQDNTAQELISVSGSQQTRQYNLKVVVEFEINDAKGRTLVEPQILTESRPITVQSNLVLGSSNEANMLYQQMRRTLAYSIMNRIASKQIARAITEAFQKP